MKKNLIGGCGIYCGACDHYLAHTLEGAHLIQTDTPMGEKLSTHPCGGCKHTDSEQICIYCRDCEIRLCTIEKQIDSCAQCGTFPCGKIKEFDGSFLLHKDEAYKAVQKFNQLGARGWLEKQQKRWSCKQCGHPHSYYEKECSHCGVQADGLFPDRR